MIARVEGQQGGEALKKVACGVIGMGIVLMALAVVGVATAVHLENRDSFCASCHTEPEVTYFNRTQAKEPSDLASAHAAYEEAVRCIDCHMTEGQTGRAEALWQGVQDTVAYVLGDYHNPAITQNPLGDAPCLKCHTLNSRDNPLTIDDDPRLLYSNSHYHWVEYLDAWQAAAPNPHGTCESCHVAHSEGTLLWLGFRDMTATNATCDACHALLSGQVP